MSEMPILQGFSAIVWYAQGLAQPSGLFPGDRRSGWPANE
jgi:hypothetical protein